MRVLEVGEKHPSLTELQGVGAAFKRLPEAFAGHFAVDLFYRGSWCPYCNAELRAFQRGLDILTSVEAKTEALSVDDEDTTEEFVGNLGLTFPAGHVADVRGITESPGPFVNDDPIHLQPTGFVLDLAGRVVVPLDSSGAARRLLHHDAAGLTRYLPEHPSGQCGH